MPKASLKALGKEKDHENRIRHSPYHGHCKRREKKLRFLHEGSGPALCKKTVNFDDPTTYHFYFGDSAGSPGTILTFFPHGDLPKGCAGTGQAVEIAFAIPKSALSFWMNRFHALGLDYQGPEKHFDETVIRINDPDGLMLEFVGTDDVSEDNLWTTRQKRRSISPHSWGSSF